MNTGQTNKYVLRHKMHYNFYTREYQVMLYVFIEHNSMFLPNLEIK